VAAPKAAPKTPVVRFSDEDLADFRNLLMKLRDDLSGKVAYLRDSSLRREDEVNHAEDGTDAFDRLFSLERAGGVQRRIYAIDEALREIDDGTYGICQSCQSLIRKQRLLALPFARNCIDCQSAQERKRGGLADAPRRFVP
jgi:DnaK suppressor protein